MKKKLLIGVIIIALLSTVFGGTRYWLADNVSISGLFISDKVGVGIEEPQAALDISGGLALAGNVLRFNPNEGIAQNNSRIVITSVLNYADIIIGTDGLASIAIRGAAGGPYLIKCHNMNCSDYTQSSALMGSNSGQDISIAISSDGTPVMSHFAGTGQDLYVSKCGNLECTSGNTNTNVDSTGSVGQYTSMTIGKDGLPIIVYYDSGNGWFKAAKCGNAACSSGNTITVIETSSSSGIHNDITLGTDGLPVISYNFGSDLLVMKCGNDACSDGNTNTSVDTGGTVAPYNSITISDDGYPIISYRDETNTALKVAKCNNHNCTSSTITTIDSAGNNGWYTRIAIGNDGLPFIVYNDDTSEKVKVVKCGNPACSTNNIIQNISLTGSASQFTSMALGSDGLPIITNSLSGVSQIQVIKCANRFCIPYWTRR